MKSTTNNTKDRDKRFFYFLILIISLTVALAVKQIFFKAERKTFDDHLEMISEEINKTCPIVMDKETRLDRTSTRGGNTFQYHYTLTNLEKGRFDEADLKAYLSESILNSIRESEDLQYFKDRGTTLVYHYSDRYRQELFTLTFTKEEYR